MIPNMSYCVYLEFSNCRRTSSNKSKLAKRFINLFACHFHLLIEHIEMKKMKRRLFLTFHDGTLACRTNSWHAVLLPVLSELCCARVERRISWHFPRWGHLSITSGLLSDDLLKNQRLWESINRKGKEKVRIL